MGTLKTWRKAYGALKDTTSVGLAYVNNDYADLEVAIVKATNHVECPPKERHFRKILFATSAVRPRADVTCCIHALARRLAKTRNWTGYSRTRDLNNEELLEQLPALQQLLYRLDGCRPEQAAASNHVIQYALALVLKESFKIYCAINDSIINLVDKFFEMPRHEAIKALDVYKRAGQQAANLSHFYGICKGLELARNFQFPILREPPQSFLVTMEDYIKEAPHVVTVLTEPVLLLTYRSEDVPTINDVKLSEEQEPSLPLDDVVVSNSEPPPPLPSHNNFETGDLLGLNDSTFDASLIEERNALSLAIVPTETGTTSAFDLSARQTKDFDPTEWELALVSTPSTNISSVNQRQLAGGFDSLTLNSLYDEGAYKSAQQPMYGVPAPNPFEVQDPFVLSSSIPLPPSVQMAAMVQQQVNLFSPYQPYQPTQQHMLMNPINPFADAGVGAFPVNPVSHPHNNPFGRTDLL